MAELFSNVLICVGAFALAGIVTLILEWLKPW